MNIYERFTFKNWLEGLEEKIEAVNPFNSIYAFIKNKLSNFFSNIKNYVLKSKRIGKAEVGFSFPKFTLDEDVKEIDYSKAGKLFEIECYFAIKKRGYQSLETENIPPYYENYKLLLQDIYETIVRKAEELADLIIKESLLSMPCVDAVIFSGNVSHRHGREDPADIKLVCKEQYTGYSIKYKFRTSAKTDINLGNIKVADIPQIETSVDFAVFLNKMISERNKTYLYLGGAINTSLQQLLSKDFVPNPDNPTQFMPITNEPVTKVSMGYRYRNTRLKIQHNRENRASISVEI